MSHVLLFETLEYGYSVLYCARLNWVEIPNEGKFVVLCTCTFSRCFVNFHSIVLWMFLKKYLFNKAKVLLHQSGFQPNIMMVHGDIAEAKSVLPINY